jgi:hypothetical protein
LPLSNTFTKEQRSNLFSKCVYYKISDHLASPNYIRDVDTIDDVEHGKLSDVNINDTSAGNDNDDILSATDYGSDDNNDNNNKNNSVNDINSPPRHKSTASNDTADV